MQIPKLIIFGVAVIVGVIFLWQYNLRPLWTNAQMNIAQDLADNKQCDQALALADFALKNHTALDAYNRLQYIELIKTCDAYYPKEDLVYAQRGVQILQEAAKIQPQYARLWLFLGSFETILGHVQQAYDDLVKADALAPRRQEVLLARIATDKMANDYPAMQTDAHACISLNQQLGDCWWNLALSQIYLQQFSQVKASIQEAEKRSYRTDTPTPLTQLLDAYTKSKNYQEVAIIYQRLIAQDESNPQYHASLAFTYKLLGKYTEARQQVKRFLELAPSQKADAETFLKTLPR